MKPIPYGKQFISEADIAAVVETLQSDYLTQGPKIKEFEDAFARYIGCDYAVALANGTAALHLCTLALNVKPGQKVITTPITFAATANCVLYCGGEVVFSDIDSNTFLLDIGKLKILLAKSPKGTYAGIIPVDFGGMPVDLEELRTLADEYNLWIIEDACHAPGGWITDSTGKGQRCGNGKYADLSIFSFHPVKHIASGEGGMVTTNNKQLYEKLLMLRTHGITRNADLFVNDQAFASADASASGYPGWYMEMQMLGYNYRLTDFQAALGLSQLRRAEEGLLRRHEIAKQYREAFKNHPKIKVQTTDSSEGFSGHAYHLFIILVPDRLGLYNYLRQNQIFAQIHYIPTHLMPFYKNLGWREGDFPMAEKYYNSCISLPMFPTLKDEEQEWVIQKVLDFLNG
jgi:UDP-4-amino-4,6-dideoxy-N-acetyl-beta-L-altrosamine transaminase